ncbi:hypothetical protein AA0117_g3622 [Alternaria alternata]|uniref:Uncharacterized protein n=2 Tax=Alternaria alternata complex TaxID=187734 RepID=A0A4Q4NPC9_ALTAL|nr:hypothetical protein AA0114_g1740 [Alternaria tenuissima]RYN79709.1 hypothetical protein AA0117_g3622 [Alternaria alternata]
MPSGQWMTISILFVNAPDEAYSFDDDDSRLH